MREKMSYSRTKNILKVCFESTVQFSREQNQFRKKKTKKFEQFTTVRISPRVYLCLCALILGHLFYLLLPFIFLVSKLPLLKDPQVDYGRSCSAARILSSRARGARDGSQRDSGD